MSSLGSVSAWIEAVKKGDHAAFARLFDRYLARLTGLARVRLHDASGYAEDEDDVALSAFLAFWQGAITEQFPSVRHRDQLWRLLAAITVHKALKLVRHETADKRNVHRKVDEAAQGKLKSESDVRGLDGLFGPDPPADLVAEVDDLHRKICADLDDECRVIFLRRLDGATCEEIAAEMGTSVRTVERRLRIIRERIARHLGD